MNRLFRGRPAGQDAQANASDNKRAGPSKWSMGVLNDPTTIEVPGSVLLLAAHVNQPLGLRNVHARNSHSSIPTGFAVDPTPSPGGTLHPRPAPEPTVEEQEEEDDGGKKKTDDGTIILEPQPDESANDPLNWPSWRRDVALLSLGMYCMIGGGITPLIAAGFTDVGDEFGIHTERVALTTGLFMMGLGVGSVVMSPTAILYGKRPVYLGSSILFIGTSLWAAGSPSFASLLAARVFQGIAVSPVECLPSATIAEIFFLHERAFRIGIYTLLLLGGKNLVPLVSAAIIGRWGWRWTFWITAMVVAVSAVSLFFFVPETFWDRTPTRKPNKRPSFMRRLSSRHDRHTHPHTPRTPVPPPPAAVLPAHDEDPTIAAGHPHSRHRGLHVGFASDTDTRNEKTETEPESGPSGQPPPEAAGALNDPAPNPTTSTPNDDGNVRRDAGPGTSAGYFPPAADGSSVANVDIRTQDPGLDVEKIAASRLRGPPKVQAYTHNLRQQPPRSFVQQLKPYHGRLNGDSWFKVMLRPFVLFAYPAVLWSAVVYACSVGWLIVISETMAIIYRDPTLYNFSALQTGLVYISPFVGGILGTAVAGKISDVIVKAMAARNGGLYEPEFRLVMGIPILITTCIGLMGFGWSAQEGNHWIVPTVFFGVMSFGCSLGSTTSITFCVDSYRQYAGEALVTLNFAKNILHGLVFSLFVTHWLADDGAKAVFIWIGVIQLILMLFTIPMFIYGKRARMWTTRMNLMERF
ncbi:uncharacterized protein J7T54_001128 [Emericellopsis cladophorae]|uniref:Major facilitator superfamily (MFS) profile domain-containing protein n=1 Tax=Emericellopsis cladophorae TaxID=2686198 RepID=A0A9Q0BAI0_9HYPO|nr:uncharacterized protein J7T54_001128 [Emericellopsis cladophorae]KAI6777590.1 hypothetical protein J7T54_001128 [Emericellopsis cladophorae]